MHILPLRKAIVGPARALRVTGRFEDRQTTLETRSACIVLVAEGNRLYFSIKAASRQTHINFCRIPAALPRTENVAAR